jgi:hypothetical protein
VKNWRNYLIAILGIVLVLVSWVIYGLRISETTIPDGSTPLQIEHLTQVYGLDRPVIEQYGAFLFTFLPGLTLLGFYGAVGLGRRDFQHWIIAKIFIVLMLVTNTATMLNFFVTAHASLQDAIPAFW